MFPDRIKRVEESIKAEIGAILQLELKDPRLKWVTVQRVAVTRDLRSARVYVSVLDDKAGHPAEVTAALDSASGYIKRLLGERIRMKFMPEFRFYIDDTPAATQHIDDLYAQARRQSEATAAADCGVDSPPRND